jgi:molybdopterin adenylyltransferase
MSDYVKSIGWDADIEQVILPDDAIRLKNILVESSSRFNIIITTGGTGIGPRDITVETVKPLLDKEVPGIMEFIRIKYGTNKPNALLSRGVAGIIGKSLIYTLPGSVTAVEEYMSEIVKSMKHLVYMQYGIDTHQRH